MADRANHFDAIVIGSGHNGLIAANYLARDSKRVLVLERRPVIGGATVTESPRPGYNLSTCSYVCNLLLPEVVRDFDLPRYGYDIRAFEPGYFTPFPDGRYFMTFHDDEKTRAQIRKFSEKDVAGYDAYWEMWNRILARMQPFLRRDLASPDEFAEAFAGPEGEDDWDTLTRKSIAEVLDRYLESDEIKAPLSTGGVIGTNAGPFDEGTAYVKFHHLIGTVEGRQGAWGYVRGGMGTVSKSLAAVARGHGVLIEVDSDVAGIDLLNGRAVGVRLVDGSRFTADVILSNADPQRTFLGMVGASHLPEDYTAAIASSRVKGSVMKVLMGIHELPDFTAIPGTEVGTQHTGGITICPSMRYLDAAWREAKSGRPATKPFMDCYIQSATEDGLAPEGKHTLSLFVQYVPYDLAEGTWEERRSEIGQIAIRTLAEYAPNIPDAIDFMEVLGPPDIERTIGITGGNIFHGEILPDQMFNGRPVPGYPSYRTPVEGLYLCGSGAWPGGAVFGAPGHNCARQVIADLAAVSV